MLETIFSGTILGSTLTISSTLAILISALILGFGISLVYMRTHKNEFYSSNYIITLIIVPAVISMLVLLVGSNIARAFSIGGALTLIRFRSAPGNARDIAYIFFSVAVGLACGIGYIGFGALFAVIVCIIMLILSKVNFGKRKNDILNLKILMPEDMEFNGVFENEMNEFTSFYKLNRVKTAEFGSLYEVTYSVILKNVNDSKTFIDKLRCKNGNLNVVLSACETANYPVL